MKYSKKNLIAVIVIFMLILQGCGYSKKSQIHILHTGQQYTGTVDTKYMRESMNEEGILFSKPLDSDNSKSILYYKDNNSGKTVALCNKPECSHDDADCPAVYNGTIKAAFFGKEHLYVFTALTRVDTAHFVKDINTTYVYEADKDGSSRKRIETLNYSIDGNFNIYDDFVNIPVVYYIPVEEKDQSGNAAGYHTSEEKEQHTVLQLDFDTGKFTKLLEPLTQPYFQWTDIEYYDGDLFIGFQYGTSEKAYYAVCQYDTSTKKMKKKYDLDRNACYIGIIGESAYYYTLNNGVMEIFKSSLENIFSSDKDNMICKGSYTSCVKMFHGLALLNEEKHQTAFLDASSGKVTDVTNTITKNVIAYGYINQNYVLVLLKQGSFECGIISFENFISDTSEYIYTGSLAG